MKNNNTYNLKYLFILLILFMQCKLSNEHKKIVDHQQWTVFETSYKSSKQYINPFTNIEVNVVLKKNELDLCQIMVPKK